MTLQLAIAVYELDNNVLATRLGEYRARTSQKHVPSKQKTKSVMAYLGHRQRTRTAFDIECVNESVAQIAKATAVAHGTVQDVLRFLEWQGG